MIPNEILERILNSIKTYKNNKNIYLTIIIIIIIIIINLLEHTRL